MRNVILLSVLSLMLVGSAYATAPVAQYDPGYPGLRIDFVADVYPGPGEDGYGYMTTKSGWTHDTWAGSASATALGRMETTMKDAGNVKTGMKEDQDWIFSATYNHINAMTGEWPIFGKHDWDLVREDRIFALTADPGTGTYGFNVGNDTGGWYVAASGLTFGAWQDITVHYKVGLGLDFYLGDTLVAANQATGHGRYDLDFMQIEWTKAGTDSWRVFKVGQVPEPMTMILLGLGGVAMLRRKRA